MNPEYPELAISTNEEYSETKARTVYLQDVLDDRVNAVWIEECSKHFFALTRKFVTAMDGRFENTIVIIMGCHGLATESMAEAFIQKGAKAYIGWNDFVIPQYVDEATIKLLEHLVLDKQTVSEAVAKTVEEVGNDPYYGATPHHYP